MIDVRRFDLNLLPVLDVLLAERSVSRAASKLGLSQPAVSSSLGRLRSVFGDELLVRSGNEMKATPFALGLVEPVTQLLEILARQVLSDQSFDPEASDRQFRIATSDIGALIIVPRIMEELSRLAPRVTLQARTVKHEDLLRELDDGAIDLAIGYFPDLQGANVIVQGLFSHPFATLARANHPDIHGKLDLETFLRLEHIIVRHESRSQELFDSAMSANGLSCRIRLEVRQALNAPFLVSTTDMICTLPLAVGTAFGGVTNLQLLQPPIEILPIEIKQFWHRRRHRDPAISWLRAVVGRAFLDRDPASDLASPIFGKGARMARDLGFFGTVNSPESNRSNPPR